MVTYLRGLCAATAMVLLTGAVPSAPASATPTSASPTSASPTSAAPAADVPVITVAIAEDRTDIQGSLTQVAGPLRLRVLAEDEDHLLSLFRLKRGYTVKEMRRDTRALTRLYYDGGEENARAVKRMQRNVITYGGANPSLGAIATATVNLRPGRYYLSDNVGPPGGRLYKLTIVPGPNAARLPTDARVITMTGQNEFESPDRLAATGTVLIRNAVPKGHRWLQTAFLQVKRGTTPAQVSALFKGTGDGGFVLSGYAGGDTLSPGQEQYLTYSVEPGTYALICFFPNPDNPGSTYVADGMVRIVTLGNASKALD
jgi:hypothetical protein